MQGGFQILVLIFIAAMVDPGDMSGSFQVLVTDLGKAFAPVGNFTAVLLIQLSGFCAKSFRCQSACTHQDMRVIIALITAGSGMWSMNAGIYSYLVSFDNTFTQLFQHSLALFLVQFTRKCNFKFSGDC